MSEQVATAQPEAIAPEATSAPETIAPDTQAQVEQIKSEAASPDADLEAIWEKHNAPAAPPKDEQATEAKPDSGQPATTAPEPAQSSPAIAAPQSWPAEYQAKWNTLTPDVQQYLAHRESQVHGWISQAGQELKTFEPIRQALGAFQGYYPQGQEAQFVASLMQANAALHHDPVGTLKALAEHYRVDPALLAGQTPQANDPSSVDDLFRDPRLDKEIKPLVQSMAQQLHQSEQRLRQMEGHLTAQQQAEIQKRQSEATNIISSFSKDKSDFSALHDDIVREVQMMDPRIPMEKRLSEAYDRARWANPVHRQRILDEERKTEAAKAQKDMAQKQAEAKKHQSMNVRTGATAPTPSKGSKWNDETELNALYDRIASRG